MAINNFNEFLKRKVVFSLKIFKNLLKRSKWKILPGKSRNFPFVTRKFEN